MAAETTLPRTLALARVRAICMGLPGAVEKEAWGQPTWRAGEKGKMFAQPTHLARAVTVPSDPTEQALLVETGPDRFFVPPYSGANGCFKPRRNFFVISCRRGRPFLSPLPIGNRLKTRHPPFFHYQT